MVQAIHNDLKEVREKDLPEIRTEMAIFKERTSGQAKTYSLIGGVIAVLMSLGISAAAMVFK
jgi:hypothetical protein